MESFRWTPRGVVVMSQGSVDLYAPQDAFFTHTGDKLLNYLQVTVLTFPSI